MTGTTLPPRKTSPFPAVPPSRGSEIAVIALGVADGLRRVLVYLIGLTAIVVAALWLAMAPARAQSAQSPAATETAIFAGGCFWCVEKDFDKVPGVLETVSGYTGGRTPDPTYDTVSAGGTGHREVVRITFDPSKVSFRQLVDFFWRTIDPLDGRGQFCDKGESYTTAIYAQGADQLRIATESRSAAEKVLGKSFVTDIGVSTRFYPAEGYHQNYHTTNTVKYNYYRWACGRDRRLQELWGDAAGRFPAPASDVPAG